MSNKLSKSIEAFLESKGIRKDDIGDWIQYLNTLKTPDKWEVIGRLVLMHLPKEEGEPFYDWLANNEAMLVLYTQDIGASLEAWKNRVTA